MSSTQRPYVNRHPYLRMQRQRMARLILSARYTNRNYHEARLIADAHSWWEYFHWLMARLS